jgi:hypothetical protein
MLFPSLIIIADSGSRNPMNTSMQKSSNPKAEQFTEEMNELCAKYQYKLVPKVSYTENGITPRIDIIDMIPPKGNLSGNGEVIKFTKKEAKKIKKNLKKLENKKS